MPVTHYVYDGDHVLQEYDDLGVTLKTYERTPSGELLSEFDGTTAKYYEPDGLGSTDALVDESQNVVDRWRYRAFGVATQTVGADITPYTFVGGQGYVDDSNTGLYYLRARYYDPATAQFLSREPVDFFEGESNVYRYVGNNPVNKTDPSGRPGAASGQWGPRPAGQPDPIITLDTIKKWFLDWYKSNQNTSWTKKLPDCPCSIFVIVAKCENLQGPFGPAVVSYETKVGNPDPGVWTNPSSRDLDLLRLIGMDFHPGAVYDMRSKNTYGGHAQQCTYDANGQLLTHTAAAGTPDWAPAPSKEHIEDDVYPYAWALKLDGGTPGKHVAMYLECRPPNQGKGCAKNPK